MGDKTEFTRSQNPQIDKNPKTFKLEWKRMSKGEMPPKDKQVIALIQYGDQHSYMVCYGTDLTVGRKHDEYTGVEHARDYWALIPSPPTFRWSGRLNKWIDLENRF